MKIRVKIDKKQAIIQGQEPRDYVVVDVPVEGMSANQRRAAACLRNDRDPRDESPTADAYLEAFWKNGVHVDANFAGGPDIQDEVEAWLEQRGAAIVEEEVEKEREKKREKEEYEAQVRRVLAEKTPRDLCTEEDSPQGPGVLWSVDSPWRLDWVKNWSLYEKDEQLGKFCRDARELAENHNNEVMVQRRAADEKKRREAKREEERIRAAILDMLSAHGTPSQVERYEAGVLPGKDLKEVVRGVLMAGMEGSGWPRYQRIGNEVEHDEYCDGACNVEFCVYELDELTDGQWTNLKAARKLVAPECSVEAELHEATPQCRQDNPTTRPAIEVRGELHGIKVSRLYALPEEVPELVRYLAGSSTEKTDPRD